MLYRLLAQKQADRIFYETAFKRVPLKEVGFYNALSKEYEATLDDWESGIISNCELYLRLKSIANVIGA